MLVKFEKYIQRKGLLGWSDIELTDQEDNWDFSCRLYKWSAAYARSKHLILILVYAFCSPFSWNGGASILFNFLDLRIFLSNINRYHRSSF